MICIFSKMAGSDTLILLGDTVSPSILNWLTQHCGLRIFGVLGRYDSAALVSELKRMGGLIECRTVRIGRIMLYGYGLTGCNPQVVENTKVDVFVSSLAGLRYTCCNKCSDLVDLLVDQLDARLVITGGCEYPCIDKRLFSPGSVQKDYVGLLEINDDTPRVYVVRLIEMIYSFINRSLTSS